jgi:hypothetical protein
MPPGLDPHTSACEHDSPLGRWSVAMRRSLEPFLIDGGFHALQFTAIGLILALWH